MNYTSNKPTVTDILVQPRYSKVIFRNPEIYGTSVAKEAQNVIN